MANFCVICERRWPPEPVRMLILGPGMWYEYCEECADTPGALECDGKPMTPREASAMCKTARIRREREAAVARLRRCPG